MEQLKTELAQCRGALKKETAMFKQLEGKKISEDILTEGLTRELDKVSIVLREAKISISWPVGLGA